MHAVFVGTVHPISGGWHLDEVITLEFPDTKWTLIVKSSNVHVAVTGDYPDDFATFTNEVTSVVQGFLDGMGFILSASLRCEMTSVILDGIEEGVGKHIVMFQPRWPELVGGKFEYRVTEDQLSPFMTATLTHPLARLALADLRIAMTTPDDTGFLAYRALESVRQFFVSEDGDDTKRNRLASWDFMRRSLNVEESATRRLEQLGTPRRHGSAQSTTASERLEAMSLARDIVSKFVHYLAENHRDN